MSSYLTVDAARARSGIPTGFSNDALTQLLEAIEFQIENFLGYSPQIATVTEFYDGNGTTYLPIEGRQPITDVLAVYENYNGFYSTDLIAADNLLTPGVGYSVARFAGHIQSLVRINTVWPVVYSRAVGRLGGNLAPCLGSVAVTYTAGLTSNQMSLVANAGYFELAAQFSAFRNGMGIQMSSTMDGYGLTLSPIQWMNGQNPGRQRFLSQVAEGILRPLKRSVFSK